MIIAFPHMYGVKYWKDGQEVESVRCCRSGLDFILPKLIEDGYFFKVYKSQGVLDEYLTRYYKKD